MPDETSLVNKGHFMLRCGGQNAIPVRGKAKKPPTGTALT